jgi:hypothetical protein
MLSRQWVARLVTITALVLPAGRMALSLPGLPPGQSSLTGHASSVSHTGSVSHASSVSQATVASTSSLGSAITLTRATSTVSVADTASTASAHGAVTPGIIRAAALQRAPLVANAKSPRSKRGLPAPPMTSAMLRANAEKQAVARKFLASKRNVAWKRHLARKRHHAQQGHHARHGQARAGHHSLTGHPARAGHQSPKGNQSPKGHQSAKGRQGKPAPKCSRRSCLTGLPAARSLAMTQQPQVRNYWCGPATVSEMLRQVGVSVSQSKAARQLNTTPGGTDWSNARGYPVPSVLNANQKRNSYVAVALPWSPTAAQVRTYENDLVADINRNGGAPIAGNAYEIPGGPHLAGHPPNQSISHWFDIRGYANSGATTKYEDSVHGAASIGWAAAVPAYSSLPSETVVNILGARGYDW